MTIELGMNVGGEHRERRVVTAIEGDIVRFVRPISLIDESCSVAEFEAWRDGA